MASFPSISNGTKIATLVQTSTASTQFGPTFVLSQGECVERYTTWFDLPAAKKLANELQAFLAANEEAAGAPEGSIRCCHCNREHVGISEVVTRAHLCLFCEKPLGAVVA